MSKKNFPNGFTSWNETHYEVVSMIVIESIKDTPSGKVGEIICDAGTGGLWELAVELTDEFEKTNEDVEWDGNYNEELEKFVNKELYGKE